MVMFCVKKGYHAGTSPALRLNHLIPKEKANKEHLKRLAFGAAFCFEPALLQVLPESKKILEESLLSAFSFSSQGAQKLAASRLGAPKAFYETIHFIGYQAGVYQALGKTLPGVVKKMISSLNLK
jgi:hypothetical protein